MNGTRYDDSILSADDLRVVKWYVDASFAVHRDFRNKTEGSSAPTISASVLFLVLSFFFFDVDWTEPCLKVITPSKYLSSRITSRP
jgi:hypothetical protein